MASRSSPPDSSTVRDSFDLSLIEAAAAIRDRSLSSTEVTKACLDRIAVWQTRIKAFVEVDGEAALAAALAADNSLARGCSCGRLHGVPLAHKDMFYRTGGITTCGSRIRRDWVAGETATVLDRLSVAGALSLGTLNMAEFAYGATGHNEHLGHCRNPWNTEFITGGSSSGSAAAVAARLVFGALGSDTGGSIRIPASLCGVTGLKPTWGRVSRAGTMPLAFSLDTVGAIARTAEDCALILQTIAGADIPDSESSCELAPDWIALLRRGSDGLRVCYAPALFDQCHPEIADAVRAALDVMRSLSIDVVETAAVPVDALSAHCMTIMQSEASSLHSAWMRKRPRDYSSQTRARLEAGFAIPAPVYLNSLRYRAKALADFYARSLDRADAFVLPTIPILAPTIEETGVGGGPSTARTLAELTRFTQWVNYLGVPALNAPCGFDSRGLPIGLQLVARPFNEQALLQIADTFQRATDWHRHAPALDTS